MGRGCRSTFSLASLAEALAASRRPAWSCRGQAIGWQPRRYRDQGEGRPRDRSGSRRRPHSTGCRAARSRPARSNVVGSVANIPDVILATLACASAWQLRMRRNASRARTSRGVRANHRAAYDDKTSAMISASTRGGRWQRRLDHRMSAVRIADRSSYLKLLRRKARRRRNCCARIC